MPSWIGCFVGLLAFLVGFVAGAVWQRRCA